MHPCHAALHACNELRASHFFLERRVELFELAAHAACRVHFNHSVVSFASLEPYRKWSSGQHGCRRRHSSLDFASNRLVHWVSVDVNNITISIVLLQCARGGWVRWLGRRTRRTHVS